MDNGLSRKLFRPCGKKKKRCKKKKKAFATFAFLWYPVQNLKEVCTSAVGGKYVIVSEFPGGIL
jgi:hypothetical protein